MAENQAEFTVQGIESENEAGTVEEELEGLDGVMGVRIDHRSGDATVRYDYDLLADERIKRTVREMGYEVD